MRHAFPCLAIGLCVLIAKPAASAAVSAIRPPPPIFRAAKKNKKTRHVRHSRERPRPSLRARGWFDPSLGPDGKP